MKRTFLVAVLVALTSCSRCGNKPGERDAGSVAAAQGTLPATDLKTALVMVFPEFRGTQVIRLNASLVRMLEWKPPSGNLGESLVEVLAPLGFVRSDGARAHGPLVVHKPFQVFYEGDPQKFAFRLVLQLSEEDVGKILQSPVPLGTEQLEQLLPVPPGAKALERPQFRLYLAYQASAKRRDFLLRQLINGMRATGWTASALPDAWDADGGDTALPDNFTVDLSRPSTGSTLSVQSESTTVSLHYRQALAAP